MPLGGGGAPTPQPPCAPPCQFFVNTPAADLRNPPPLVVPLVTQFFRSCKCATSPVVTPQGGGRRGERGFVGVGWTTALLPPFPTIS